MFGGNARDREGPDKTLVDDDQEAKYEEIIELLKAGGYFRARINGLSRFDKVVGGMSWCITASNEDVDIDLFFIEEASIGQRIKIGEGIIRALQRMKCPYRLEPNQIQGGANTSDFVAIFPVIQWLVKKVIETREETGDLMRQFSESQFSKFHKMPEDEALDKRKPAAISFMKEVSDRYVPGRKFKRQGRRVPYINKRAEEENVQSVLLEYGDTYVAPKQKSDPKQTEAAKKLEEALGGKKKNTDDIDDNARKREELKKEMSKYVGGNIDRGVLENLLPTNIEEMESQYATTEESNISPEQAQKMFGLKLHQQNVNKINKDIAQQKRELEALEEIYNTHAKQLEEIQAQYNKKVAYNQRIVEEIAKLDALETPENTKVLQMLKSLVALNENLKAQEQKFKASCKKQLTTLKEQIEQLKNEISGSSKTQQEEMIIEAHKSNSEKLKKARQLLARKNRDIALLERKIDEVPSRTELIQYQRQFVELYEQVASKYIETKQYFNSYNTLGKTQEFLSKEVSILNSIHDNYKSAMTSKSSKEQFLDSITNIAKSVAQNLEKVEQKLNQEKETKNKLTEQHNALLEKERLYYKLTKEFFEECRKNEALKAKLLDEE